MSDAEQVQQALAELWDIVRCRCNEAYTGRGLHDPDCQCDSTDALQIVADRIEALTAKINLMDDLDAINGEKIEALSAERDWYMEEWVSAVDRLNKAVEALEEIAGNGNADGRNPQLMSDKARAALAEIKGESHE